MLGTHLMHLTIRQMIEERRLSLKTL